MFRLAADRNEARRIVAATPLARIAATLPDGRVRVKVYGREETARITSMVQASPHSFLPVDIAL